MNTPDRHQLSWFCMQPQNSDAYNACWSISTTLKIKKSKLSYYADKKQNTKTVVCTIQEPETPPDIKIAEKLKAKLLLWKSLPWQNLETSTLLLTSLHHIWPLLKQACACLLHFAKSFIVQQALHSLRLCASLRWLNEWYSSTCSLVPWNIQLQTSTYGKVNLKMQRQLKTLRAGNLRVNYNQWFGKIQVLSNCFLITMYIEEVTLLSMCTSKFQWCKGGSFHPFENIFFVLCVCAMVKFFW